MTIIRPELRAKTTAGGGHRIVRGSGLEPANKDLYRHSLIDPAANNNPTIQSESESESMPSTAATESAVLSSR
jgi:hypothetical protein